MFRHPTFLAGLLVLLLPSAVAAGVLRPVEAYERVTSPEPRWVAFFGSGTATDGRTLVVGARFEDAAWSPNSGAAYVFERDTLAETWQPLLRIPNPHPWTNAQFGRGVALDGDRLAVGSGWTGDVVALLERQPDGTWKTRQNTWSPRLGFAESFGRSIILRGSTLLVGAPMTSDQPGRVYVYELDEATGSFRRTGFLVGAQEPAEDAFGHDLALDGDRLAVASPSTEVGRGGVVHLYERSATSGWAWVGSVRSPLPDRPYNFGLSVDLRRDLLLVGSPYDNRGQVFELVDGVWVHTAELRDTDYRPGNFDFEGADVALTADARQAVVTATQVRRGSGGAYVHQRTRSGDWIETWRFYGPEAYEQLGGGLSLHGRTVVVGSTADVDGLIQAGAVYLFDVALLPEPVIDVRPGSADNPIRPSSRGTLTLAVVSTQTAVAEPLDFDAAEIDPSTLRVGPLEVRPVKSRLRDLDHDGDLDLLLQVRTRDLGLTCADGALILHGQTQSGQVFFGNDTVSPVGCD